MSVDSYKSFSEYPNEQDYFLSIDPAKLSEEFQQTILAKISKYFALRIEDLNIVHNMAFKSQEVKNMFGFYVFDKNQNSYGVSALIDRQGNLYEYRCFKM